MWSKPGLEPGGVCRVCSAQGPMTENTSGGKMCMMKSKQGKVLLRIFKLLFFSLETLTGVNCGWGSYMLIMIDN